MEAVQAGLLKVSVWDQAFGKTYPLMKGLVEDALSAERKIREQRDLMYATADSLSAAKLSRMKYFEELHRVDREMAKYVSSFGTSLGWLEKRIHTVYDVDHASRMMKVLEQTITPSAALLGPGSPFGKLATLFMDRDAEAGAIVWTQDDDVVPSLAALNISRAVAPPPVQPQHVNLKIKLSVTCHRCGQQTIVDGAEGTITLGPDGELPINITTIPLCTRCLQDWNGTAEDLARINQEGGAPSKVRFAEEEIVGEDGRPVKVCYLVRDDDDDDDDSKH
jgi:hypothetical protein